MGQIVPRLILPLLQSALKERRVTAILGARQVGKSTLARSLPNSYYSLDEPGIRSFAERDPMGFARELPVGAVIDEIQRAPDLLLAIKSIVDLDQTPGRFVLTGSANILTLPKFSDSLAGRMRILEIHPLAEIEIEGGAHNIVDRFFDEHSFSSTATSAAPKTDIISRILRGGYPEAMRFADPTSRNAWFSDYLLSILQREVREISHIGDLADMERLIRILAVRTGLLLSPTALSSDIGIPKETLRRYFRILEQLYLVHVLPAWSGEPGRRYIKAPKLHINDTGLAAYELGADYHALSTNRDLLGNLLETFVVNETRKQASWSKTQPKLYHLRTHGGKEIDLILQARDGRSVAVEIKASASPSARDTNVLREVVADARMIRGILLYTGEQTVPIAERVHAVPIASLWE
jgi:uncharacterized protein